MFTRATLAIFAIAAMQLIAVPTNGAEPSGRTSFNQQRGRQTASNSSLSQALSQRANNTQRKVTAISPVTIETVGPQGIELGRPARFVLKVYNTGQTPTDAIVVVEVSEHAKLEAIEPKPQYAQDQVMQFLVKQVPARGLSELVIEATTDKPEAMEVNAKVVLTGTTATVVQIKQPDLSIVCEAPQESVAGVPVQVRVQVTNRGSGTANQVTVSPTVSDGARLVNPQKYPLAVGSIPAGRAIETMLEVIPGPEATLKVDVQAEADNFETVKHAATLPVQHPGLTLKVEGPALRYINRTAIYQISVENPGDSATESITITATVPTQLLVTGIESRTEFDRQKHTLTWKLPALKAGQTELLGFEVKALEEGNHATEITAVAKHGIAARTSQPTHVISRADLNMTVVDSEEAVEVGGAVSLLIEVANRGSKAAENVQVSVKLPEGLELAEGSSLTMEDGVVHFPSLAKLDPDEKHQLKLSVVGRKAGDHLTEVVLHSDSLTHDLIVQQNSFFYDGKSERVARTPQKPQPSAPAPKPTSSRQPVPEADQQ